MKRDHTIVTLAKEIWRLKDELGTWAEVGRHYDVSRVVVWRIANEGYEPKAEEIRSKLGLTERIVQEVKRDKFGRFTK